MRAVRYFRYGGPEVLEMAEVPVPEPVAAGQVLIEVEASATSPSSTARR
jgi:NADPH2:quinone reductase